MFRQTIVYPTNSASSQKWTVRTGVGDEENMAERDATNDVADLMDMHTEGGGGEMEA